MSRLHEDEPIDDVKGRRAGEGDKYCIAGKVLYRVCTTVSCMPASLRAAGRALYTVLRSTADGLHLLVVSYVVASTKHSLGIKRAGMGAEGIRDSGRNTRFGRSRRARAYIC